MPLLADLPLDAVADHRPRHQRLRERAAVDLGVGRSVLWADPATSDHHPG
jgi:hypothetical protein